MLTAAQGPFTGTVQIRYVGSGRYYTITPSGGAAIDVTDPDYDSTDPNSITNNTVESAVYVNLSGSFDVTEQIQLFGSINNLLDRDPPVAPGGNGYPTNPVYFDTYGRLWRAGVRVKF